MKFWQREKWRITFLACTLSATAIGTVYLWHREPPLSVAALAPRVNVTVDAVLAEREEEQRAEKYDVPFGDEETVNVLLLGIDSRKEGKEKHCDAIHMISVNVHDWTVNVTSVPRGTYAFIPPGTWKENEYYLANACAFAGIDYGVEQIERVVGVRADYVVTVGFSQTLGILRTLELPTTESLQWLRHRRSYAVGDPQRSHNQAVFMKDVALKLLRDDGIPDPIFRLLYSFVETDMEYATAKTLYDGLLLHRIADRPDNISLSMKPREKVRDIHFDPEHAEEQIAALLEKLEGRLNRFDLSGRSIGEIQADLVTYLSAYLAEGKDASSIVHERLWEQIENEGERESLHYQCIALFAHQRAEQNRDDAVRIVADYILEMQTQGLFVWEQKGRSLLEMYVE